MIGLLNDFVLEHNLNDEQYAKVLETLIGKYQINDLSVDHKKELKKITNKPPVKIYFDLLYKKRIKGSLFR